MKLARLTVQRSTRFPELQSIRGPEGENPRRAVTAAGFEDGERVVVLRRHDYFELLELVWSRKHQ